MILTANPDYYGDEPEMKTVTVLFMDEDAAYAAALSGQVDLAYTSAAYSDQTVDGFPCWPARPWTTAASTCRRSRRGDG